MPPAFIHTGRFPGSGGIPIINRSHPLARDLAAAYYPGAFPNGTITNLAAPGNGDLVTRGATGSTPLAATPEGPGISTFGTGTATRYVNGLCPPSLLNSRCSFFVRGQWKGASGTNSPSRVFGVWYNATSTNPFTTYAIVTSDPSQAQCLAAFWADSGGAFAYPTIPGTRTLTTNQMFSGGLAMLATSGGSLNPPIRLYQNGVPFSVNLNVAAGFSGTGPQIGFGDSNSARSSASVPTVAYAWNRVLSDGEQLYLDANPYALLRWPVDIVYDVLAKPSVLPSGVIVNKPMIFSPLMLAGVGGLEWLRKRKIKMRQLRGQ